MRLIPGLLALVTLSHAGCGQATPYPSVSGRAYESASPSFDAAVPPMEAGDERFLSSDAAPEPMMGMMDGGGAPGTELQDAPPPGETAFNRKIIYDAQIELVVEDLDPAAEQIVALVQQHQGYIAEQDLSGAPGSRRSGRWKLRVPVDQFEDFVRELLGLGELVRNQRTSQDVTEQFYDIEARIRNKRVEEETLLKILEERSGKLEDVLKVQIELSRTRGEIEQMQGRLRVLENLSGLATVTLTLREREDYTPTPPVAPDFSTRIGRAWSGSLTELQKSGENFVVFLVGAAPWLPLILGGILLGVLFVRFLWRRLLRALARLWEFLRRPVVPPPSSS